MKVRPARSFERAVQQIISGIGEEAAAKAVDRSTSLVRKWSDQDNPTLPSLKQALDLDEAYVTLKKEPAPIMAVYMHRLETALTFIENEDEPILKALFSLQMATANVTRELADVLGTDTPNKEVKIAPRQKSAVIGLIEKVAEEANDLERAVKSQ